MGFISLVNTSNENKEIQSSTIIFASTLYHIMGQKICFGFCKWMNRKQIIGFLFPIQGA